MDRPAVPLRTVAERLERAGLLQGTQGSLDVLVQGVSQDSREVSPGDLFLAWKGTERDGHDFLQEAVARGAVAAVVERTLPRLGVPQLQARDGRAAAALAADTVAGSPWSRLFLAGVTGTNGKTTTAFLVRHLLERAGRPSAALGTLGLVDREGRVRPGTEGLTTPGPALLARWLARLEAEGVEGVVMEASSHALDQRRLDGVRFDAAVFTNLTRDHLDYHGTLEAYRQAKLRLAELLKPQGWVVVNAEEEAWSGVHGPGGHTLPFSVGGRAQGARALRAWDVEVGPDGSRFVLAFGEEEVPVRLPLLGRFNVENALAAAGVALVAGLSLRSIGALLSEAPQIPGRLEVVLRHPFTVLLDYAHTPHALETVLRTLRPLTRGRLIVLFGAGGDRDPGKRPLMGAVVARLADLAVVTSDNPRTEPPETILDQIIAGMEGAPWRRIVDRREAIAAALAEARPGDVVLLAGKGHEAYQVVGTERIPFPEGEIVRELMAEKGRGRR